MRTFALAVALGISLVGPAHAQPPPSRMAEWWGIHVRSRPILVSADELAPIELGQSAQLVYRIRNLSSAEQKVSVDVDLTGGTVVAGATSTLTIPSDTEQSFSATLLPQVAGVLTATVSVQSGWHDFNPAIRSIPQAGSARGGYVSRRTASVEFPVTLSHARLAAYWAPVFAQDIDDSDVKADYITRFDYDGDWGGKNNWSSLDRHPTPAYIYYWVNETSSAYYIGYGMFHPRDWSDWGGHLATEAFGVETLEHTNDMEGVLITVRKDPTVPAGQFLSMVTVAHSHFFSFTDRDTPATAPGYSSVALSSSVIDGDEDIDGETDFVLDIWGLHPVVYIEAEGHGTYGTPDPSSDPAYGVTDYPPIFAKNKMTDWRGHSAWTGIIDVPLPAGSDTDGWDDGVLYHYENVADVPAWATESNDNMPRNWQVIGYQLLDITPIYARREDFNCASAVPHTFKSPGDFQGPGAQAPWGWDDGNDNATRGAMFLDPAALVASYFQGLGLGMDSTYSKRSYSDDMLPCQ